MIDERAERFRQLRWSLQALVASNQPPLFPEWAATPDHLAVQFDQCAASVVEHHAEELEDRQRAGLDAISQLLARMSHDGVEYDADLWSTAALVTSEEWAAVRRLALEGLDAFGWPDDLPQANSEDQGV